MLSGGRTARPRLLVCSLSLNLGCLPPSSPGPGSTLAAVLLLAIEGEVSSGLYSHILCTVHAPLGLGDFCSTPDVGFDGLLFSLQLRK